MIISKKLFIPIIILSVLLQVFVSNFALAADDQSVITLIVGVVADFIGSPQSGIAPLTVNFTDLSNIGDNTTYAWNFGDNGSSTAQNPSHTYTAAGSYTVSLTVSDGVTSDTETKTNYITVTSPGVPGPKPPSPPSPAPPFIYNVRAVSTEYSAIITWQTLEPASTELEWGQTQDYEKGKVTARENDLIFDHQIILENLTPDTLYHFRIKARTSHGFEVTSQDYTLRTLLIDLIPPANVSDFQAIPGDEQITLQWINPPDDDFAGVKIMRSTEFFPLSPEQGQEIYNGTGQEFIDKGLENGQRYYYTAFAYDTSNNFASGAIATAFPWPPEEPLPPEIPPIFPPEFPWPPEWPPITPLPPEPPIFPPIEEITIQDIEFFQEGRQLFPDKEGRVKAMADLPIEVSIPAQKLPYALKSIILNIALVQDSQLASIATELGQPQSVSYLFKINPEKTAYQASIVAPTRPGTYDLALMILNYQEGTISKITGQFIIRQPITLAALQEVPAIYGLIFLIIISLIILFLAWLWSKKREEDKKDSQLKPQYNE